MHIKLKTSLLTAAASLCALGVQAVPAKPGPVVRHQADGSTVVVQLRGDEHSHIILSEDGFPLVEHEGFLYFAVPGESGRLEAGAYRADRRDATTEAFLSTLDKEALFSGAVEEAERNASRSKVRRRGPGLCSTTFPGKGDRKGLVILVSYSDVDFTLSDPKQYFSDALNKEGFSEWGGTGSARDYFIDSSNGQFRPEFDVYGPVKLPNRMAYYGGNDIAGDDLHPELMAVHACQILDDTVDFTQYDLDGDGEIDNVFIFYAGRGEASGGEASTVWPHSWDVRSGGSYYSFDGVFLGHYACTNEWEGNRPDGIGTFCHEFSHVMGLPDLYSTKYTGAFTPGSWNVLDYGPYNNGGCTPPLYSAFERYAMDWMTPEPLSGPANVVLPPIDSNKAYIIPTEKDNEYFLIENRQQTGWDKYLPGHGMLVWHVDFNQTVWNKNVVNNTADHQYVDIEEADGIRSEETRAGDAFPGTAGKTEFSDTTVPSMKTWAGKSLGLPLTEIAETGGVVSFKVAGGLAESDPTETLAAENVGHDGFTARWKPVDGAEKYQLNVYRHADRQEAPGRMKSPNTVSVSVAGTSYKVEGLEPETAYAYSVAALQPGKGLSKVSNETVVRTGLPPFTSRRPVALEAEAVTDSTFLARWEAMEDASDYLLNVSKLNRLGCSVDTVDFTGGTAALPAGWHSSTTLTYSTADFCGASVPALRFSSDGAYIQSPEYNADIVSLSFWQLGMEGADANSLEVSFYVDGVWSETPLRMAPTLKGETVEISDIPQGARAVAIRYVQAKGNHSSVAIDDIAVGWNASYAEEPLALFTDRISNGALELAVNGLEPDTRYSYTVTGMAASEERSLPSSAVVVTTASKDMSGVDAVQSASQLTVDGLVARIPGVSSVSVFDPAGKAASCDVRLDQDGVRVGFFAPGVYVIVAGDKRYKVAVR